MPGAFDVAAALVRLVHLGGACLLTGVFAFLVFVARPAVNAAEPGARARFEPLDRRLLTLATVALGAGLATGLLDLARQAFVATGSGASWNLGPRIVGALLLETRYGNVWLVRHALWLLLAALLILREPERNRADWLALRLAGLVLGAAGLVAGAASGHAASAPGRADLAVAADALHLLAAGVWAGALVPFALFLRWIQPDRHDASVSAACVTAVRRFSALGLTSVSVLVATGAYAVLPQIGSIPALLGTTYGRWLSAKLAILLPLLALAFYNRARLKPRIETEGAPVARLSRLVLLEALLVAAILAAVAVLGLTTPARHGPIAWPLPFRFSWETIADLPGAWVRLAVGGHLAVFGLATALAAIALRRCWWSRPTFVGGALAAGLGLVAALPPLTVDAYPTTYVRPTVPYTAASIVRGQTLYRDHCAACHGARGAGTAAPGVEPRSATLTGSHLAGHTAGDLFWWLTHGVPNSTMPAFGDRFSPEQRWDVVNFLRTLASAADARDLAPLASPLAKIVAPDLSYTTGVGAERSLRDYRGQAVVVLVFFRLPESLERLSSLGRRHFDFRVIGSEILAVPLQGASTVYRGLGHRPVLFPVAIEGAEPASAAYALFGRDLSLTHMEMLIDRQGYLRARWLPPGSPDATGGWSDVDALLKEVQRLAAEPSSAPTATEHVH